MVNEKPTPTPTEEENSLPYHDHPFIGATISALDAEYTRSSMKLVIDGSNEEQHRRITAWLIDKYLNFKASTYFTMQSMGELTNFIFEDEGIRDFVLNVTERACVAAGTLKGGKDDGEGVVESFIAGFILSVESNHSNPNSEAMMAPGPVAASLHIEKEIIEIAVNQNKWLLVLFSVFMFIEQSEMFQGVLKDLTAVKKSEKK